MSLSKLFSLDTTGKVCPFEIYKSDKNKEIIDVVKDVVFAFPSECKALIQWTYHECPRCCNSGVRSIILDLLMSVNKMGSQCMISAAKTALVAACGAKILSHDFQTTISVSLIAALASSACSLHEVLNQISDSVSFMVNNLAVYRAFLIRQIIRVIFSIISIIACKQVASMFSSQFHTYSSEAQANGKAGLIAAVILALFGVNTLGPAFNAAIQIVNIADLRAEFKRGFESFVEAILKLIQKITSYFNENASSIFGCAVDSWKAQRAGMDQSLFEQGVKEANALLGVKGSPYGFIGSELLETNIVRIQSDLQKFKLQPMSQVQYQTVEQLVTRLDLLLDESRWMSTMCESRFSPRMMYLFGHPGIGKSFCAEKLMSAIWSTYSMRCEHLPEHLKNKDVSSLYYARNADSEFYDGYSGHPIIYFSDIFKNSFTQDQNAKQAHFRELGEIQRLVDTAPYYPPFAFEATPRKHGKGVAIAPHFVLATGNYMRVTLHGDKDVISRRIHTAILVVLADEIKRPDFTHLKFFKMRVPFGKQQDSWEAPYSNEKQLPRTMTDFQTWQYRDLFEEIYPSELVHQFVEDAIDEQERFMNVRSSAINPFEPSLSLVDAWDRVDFHDLQAHWIKLGAHKMGEDLELKRAGKIYQIKDKAAIVEVRHGKSTRIYRYDPERKWYRRALRGGANDQHMCRVVEPPHTSSGLNDCLFNAIAGNFGWNATGMRQRCSRFWSKRNSKRHEIDNPFRDGVMIYDDDLHYVASALRVQIRLWYKSDEGYYIFQDIGRSCKHVANVFHSGEHFMVAIPENPDSDVEEIPNKSSGATTSELDIQFATRGVILGPLPYQQLKRAFGVDGNSINKLSHIAQRNGISCAVVHSMGSNISEIKSNAKMYKSDHKRDPHVYFVIGDDVYLRFNNTVSSVFDSDYLNMVDVLAGSIHNFPRIVEFANEYDRGVRELRIQLPELVHEAAQLLCVTDDIFLANFAPALCSGAIGSCVKYTLDLNHVHYINDSFLNHCDTFSSLKRFSGYCSTRIPFISEQRQWQLRNILDVLRQMMPDLLICGAAIAGVAYLFTKMLKYLFKGAKKVKDRILGCFSVISSCGQITREQRAKLRAFCADNGVTYTEDAQEFLLKDPVKDVISLCANDMILIPQETFSSMHLCLRASMLRPVNFPRVSVVDDKEQEVTFVTGLRLQKGLVVFPAHVTAGFSKPYKLLVDRTLYELDSIITRPFGNAHDLSAIMSVNNFSEGVAGRAFQKEDFRAHNVPENGKVLALVIRDGNIHAQFANVDEVVMETKSVKHRDGVSRELRGYIVGALKLRPGDCGSLLIHKGKIIGFLSASTDELGGKSLWTSINEMQVADLIKRHGDMLKPVHEGQMATSCGFGMHPEVKGIGTPISNFHHFKQRPFNENDYAPERTEIAEQLDPDNAWAPAKQTYRAWLGVQSKFPKGNFRRLAPEIDEVLDHYFQAWNTKCDVLPDWTSTANGCIDTACLNTVLKPVVLSTSPGKPYTEPQNAVPSSNQTLRELCGSSDKTKMYTHDGGKLVPHAELVKQCEFVWKAWLRGRIERVPFTCNLKREIRDAERVQQHKTRLFVAPPHHLNLCLRRLLGDWAGRMKQQGRRLQHAIGVNVHSSVEWRNIREHLASAGWKVIGPDFSAYDTSHLPEMNQKVANYLCRFYPKEYHQAIRAALLSICMFEHLDETEQISHTGLASGSQVTTQINCVYTWVLYHAALLRWFKGDWHAVRENSRFICYGDDAVLAMSDSVIGADGGRAFIKFLIDFMHENNYKLTNGDKGDIEAFVGISKVRFLKRLFYHNPATNNMCCPLPFDQMFKPVLFYADGNEDHEENRQSSLRSLALEIAECNEADRNRFSEQIRKAVAMSPKWQQSYNTINFPDWLRTVSLVKQMRDKTGWTPDFAQRLYGSGYESEIDWSHGSAWCS